MNLENLVIIFAYICMNWISITLNNMRNLGAQHFVATQSALRFIDYPAPGTATREVPKPTGKLFIGTCPPWKRSFRRIRQIARHGWDSSRTLGTLSTACLAKIAKMSARLRLRHLRRNPEISYLCGAGLEQSTALWGAISTVQAGHSMKFIEILWNSIKLLWINAMQSF